MTTPAKGDQIVGLLRRRTRSDEPSRGTRMPRDDLVRGVGPDPFDPDVD